MVLAAEKCKIKGPVSGKESASALMCGLAALLVAQTKHWQKHLMEARLIWLMLLESSVIII